MSPVLKLLHLVFMAAWFGSVLFVAGDVRRTVATDGADLDLLRDRCARYKRISMVSAILTLATGFGLIFTRGGMGAVPFPIHISILTGLAALVVGAAGIGKTWQRIDGRLSGGASAADVAGDVKKLGMFTMVFHTLWLGTLVLMVFRHLLA